MTLNKLALLCLAAASLLFSSQSHAGLMGNVVKGAAFGAGAAAASAAVHSAVRNSNVDCKFPKNQKEKDQCAAARNAQTAQPQQPSAPQAPAPANPAAPATQR